MDGIIKNQHKLNETTCLTDDFPETNLFNNDTDKVIDKKTQQANEIGYAIAPGEGKIPTALMRDNDWDVNAFPNLFPTGRFGMKFDRPNKLSVQ